MELLRGTSFFIFCKKKYFTFIYFLCNILGLKNRIYYLSKWIINNGDNNFLINYPLNNKSVIYDIGGYKGNFSDKIINKYNPYVIIFEPVLRYYSFLKNKYNNNKKVTIHNYGLSDKNSKCEIFISNDGTSLIKKGDIKEIIKLVDISELTSKAKKIDLMSINIEGAEYVVLNKLISSKEIKKIKYIQIQFHDFVENSVKLRSEIIKKIKKTHKIVYSYPFVWESFKRIS